MLFSQLLEQTKTPYLFFNRFFGTGKCSPGALFSDHISWSIGATNSSVNDPFFRQEKKELREFYDVQNEFVLWLSACSIM